MELSQLSQLSMISQCFRHFSIGHRMPEVLPTPLQAAARDVSYHRGAERPRRIAREIYELLIFLNVLVIEIYRNVRFCILIYIYWFLQYLGNLMEITWKSNGFTLWKSNVVSRRPRETMGGAPGKPSENTAMSPRKIYGFLKVFMGFMVADLWLS